MNKFFKKLNSYNVISMVRRNKMEKEKLNWEDIDATLQR